MKEIAREIFFELEELIRDGVDEDGVAEGWLEDWDDVEYKTSRRGNYRGVVLYQENYIRGCDIEIDTAKMMLTVLDADGKIAALHWVEDVETVSALRVIDALWEEEYCSEMD